jgi:hypothetical protein
MHGIRLKTNSAQELVARGGSDVHPGRPTYTEREQSYCDCLCRIQVVSEASSGQNIMRRTNAPIDTLNLSHPKTSSKMAKTGALE